jgi:hypothetical protein
MRDHVSKPRDGRRKSSLAAPATVAASTLALALPVALPANARTQVSAGRGGKSQRVALPAATVSSHGHPMSLPHPADLIAFPARTDFRAVPVSTGSVVYPHERLTPTVSARGPPGGAGNP